LRYRQSEDTFLDWLGSKRDFQLEDEGEDEVLEKEDYMEQPVGVAKQEIFVISLPRVD